MKLELSLVLVSLALCAGQITPFSTIKRIVPARIVGVALDTSGQYYHDNSGSYDGRYQHDNSGAYVPDNSGQYSGDYEKYRHQEGPNGPNNGQYNGDNGQYTGGNNPYRGSGGAALIGVARPVGVVSRPVNVVSNTVLVRPVVGSSSGVTSGLKQGSAAGLYDNRNYAIIRKVENVEDDGYHYLYETENGILAEEQGKLANKGQKDEAMRASGFFTYTGPDNVVYRVEYTADENGFVPQGAHLPIPPPIPEAIARSLEYQRQLGQL